MPDSARHTPSATPGRPSRFGYARWLGLIAAAGLAAGLWWTRPQPAAGPNAPTLTLGDRMAAGAPALPASDGMPVVSLALPAAAGDAQPVALAVPRGTAMVHLRLVGDLPAAVDLTAELAAVGRDEVKRWPVDDAPAGDDGATRLVSLPPYVVPAGDYVLTLWAGDADVVQRYAFRVTP